MNANDVLIDLLEDNRRRLKRVFDVMNDECVYWKPDRGTNNIAVTVWHMARIFDVFLTQQVKGDLPGEACWFRQGWAEQTGYDPRGIGENGWGMITGYTLEEVKAIPQLSRGQMLGYLDEVYDMVKEYLSKTPIEVLLTPCAGFDGKYTKYQCIQMALLDNVRHLGEIYAIQSRWDREMK
ncbi:MAG: DinB family protein [Chloroflexota bacterium]